MNAKAVAAEEDDAPRHPRNTLSLHGHAGAEAALLLSYRSGRMPHAWLIGGPKGIGKATLAYRLARFILANPDPASAAVAAAPSLALPSDHPVVRRVGAQGESDLLALERTVGDSGKLRTEITVDQVRRTVGFFGSTAGEGGWRICIVDSIDELNRAGLNALLKVLEEPPHRSLLILLSHAPGQVLPTVRSRCRRLLLRPLAPDDVALAAAEALDTEPGDEDLRKAAALADGSVARAIALHDGPMLALRERIAGLLARLPDTDPLALHALGETLSRPGSEAFETFLDTVRTWLSGQLGRQPNGARMAAVADAWDRFNRTAADAEEYNLDKKPLVFSAFSVLADAAR